MPANIRETLIGFGKGKQTDIATANLVRGFQFQESVLDCRELGVGSHPRVERSSYVFRIAMYALHVLKKADYFRDTLCQRVIELFRDSRDFRAHFVAHSSQAARNAHEMTRNHRERSARAAPPRHALPR